MNCALFVLSKYFLLPVIALKLFPLSRRRLTACPQSTQDTHQILTLQILWRCTYLTLEENAWEVIIHSLLVLGGRMDPLTYSVGQTNEPEGFLFDLRKYCVGSVLAHLSNQKWC